MVTLTPRKIMANVFADALAAAGVIQDDLSTIARIVIDAKAGQPVKLYLERYGDERLLNVAATLEGIQIVREQP